MNSLKLFSVQNILYFSCHDTEMILDQLNRSDGDKKQKTFLEQIIESMAKNHRYFLQTINPCPQSNPEVEMYKDNG
jgi:hypothetical protein